MRLGILRRFFSDQTSFGENVSLVYAVSFADFIFSIVSNLAVPFVATRSEFANYRTLVLYSTYAGLFHFGLLSGFYLYVVGRPRRAIDQDVVAKVRRTLASLLVVVLPIAFMVLNMVLQHPDTFLIWAIVISWGTINFITLHNYLFLGTNGFRPYAFVNLISRATAILLMGYFVVSRTATTHNLILAFLLPSFVALALYALIEWLGRRRHFYDLNEQDTTVGLKLWELWRRGIVLQLANVCVLLLFTVDNLLVSVLFGTVEFASYSFAFGLTSVIYLAIDGLAVATAPYVAKLLHDKTRKMDVSYFSATILIWFAPLSYWGGRLLISAFFPQYTAAIPLLLFFSAALPFGAFIRSRLVAILTASRQEKILFTFGALSLLLTTALVIASVKFQSTLTAVAGGWSTALILVGIMGGSFFSRYLPRLNVPRNTSPFAAAILSTSLFAVCAVLSDNLMIGLVYLGGGAGALWYNWRILRDTRSEARAQATND
jgi:O-antigen/teichoic acid export membrane protein